MVRLCRVVVAAALVALGARAEDLTDHEYHQYMDDMAQEGEHDQTMEDMMHEGEQVEEEHMEHEETDSEEGMEMQNEAPEPLSEEQIKLLFPKIDANKDGKISLAEIMDFHDEMRKKISQQEIVSVLEEMDTQEKDGLVSLDELLKTMETWFSDDENKEHTIELEKGKFKAADKNHDGKLSKEEMAMMFYPETDTAVLTIAAHGTLKLMDHNNDGVLTIEEFLPHPGSEEDDYQEPHSEEELADFKQFDKNGDGKLDLDELKAYESGRFFVEKAMKELVQTADTDHDNQASLAELLATRERLVETDAHMHLSEWSEHIEL